MVVAIKPFLFLVLFVGSQSIASDWSDVSSVEGWRLRSHLNGIGWEFFEHADGGFHGLGVDFIGGRWWSRVFCFGRGAWMGDLEAWFAPTRLKAIFVVGFWLRWYRRWGWRTE